MVANQPPSTLGAMSDRHDAARTPPGVYRLVERLIVARPVEDTLVGVVLVFRTGSLVWMAALVVSTLANDAEADERIVVGSMIVAVLWTIATFVVARADVLGRKWYALVDGAIALAMSLTPGIAGAEFRFFGGMPLSWLFVAALAGGFAWVIWASLLIGALQVAGVFVLETGYGPTETIGQVMIFLVPAVVIGFAFDTLRWAEGALAEERSRRIVEQERADVADRLHDSVLQTLSLIEGRTTEPAIRNLARRERRKLRGLIDRLSFGDDTSIKARLLELAEDVEDDHLITVESAIVGNASMDQALERLVAVVHEALVNAAKHSGSDRVSVYVEVGAETVLATVKDDGVGLERTEAKRRLESRYLQRLGGGAIRATVRSGPDQPTVVEVEMARDADA